MSRGLKINPAGDLVLDDRKRLHVISGTEKALQDIAVILRSLKGTFHLNTDFGTDHIAIVESQWNGMVIQGEIRKALASYTVLESIDSITCTVDDSRRVHVAMSGTLTTGEQIFLEETL